MNKQMQAATKQAGDTDEALRPPDLDAVLGQHKVKESLAILIQAARMRREPLDHVLFHGPPGLGKTTLALVLSQEMKANIKITSGTALRTVDDLVNALTHLRAGDLLFIDEIHRLKRTIEEVLYPAMEDGIVDIPFSKGSYSHVSRYKLPKFTLVAATTRLSLLQAPFRARFGAMYRLEYYETTDVEAIVTRAAQLTKVRATPEGVHEIAKRSRGTPRIALRLFRRVRDYAMVKTNDRVLTGGIAKDALDMLQIDSLGLDDTDVRVLQMVIERYKGGPVGLSTLAASVHEEEATLSEIVEPYLLQLGLLERTGKGRKATALAYRHLGFVEGLTEHEAIL